MQVPDTVPVHDLQRSLGRRIRELRSKHGWTQEQFAEYCGLHRTYMGHVERGEKNVSLSTVARVANALGVGIAALFGRLHESAGGAPKPRRQATRAGGSPVRWDVIRLLDELAAQRKAMRQALRDLSRLVMRLSGALENSSDLSG